VVVGEMGNCHPLPTPLFLSYPAHGSGTGRGALIWRSNWVARLCSLAARSERSRRLALRSRCSIQWRSPVLQNLLFPECRPQTSHKPVSGPRHGCSQLGDCSKEALRGFRPYLDGSGVRRPAQNVLEETPSRLLYLISVHGVSNVQFSSNWHGVRNSAANPVTISLKMGGMRRARSN
jgi:hypothetical protein